MTYVYVAVRPCDGSSIMPSSKTMKGTRSIIHLRPNNQICGTRDQMKNPEHAKVVASEETQDRPGYTVAGGATVRHPNPVDTARETRGWKPK